MLKQVFAVLVAGGVPVAAHAAILNATPSNLTTVFAAAREGDTINLVGTFGRVSFQNRIFAKGVTLNASKAVFTDTLNIQNVVGMSFVGGTFDLRSQTIPYRRAVAIYNSNAVNFQSNTFLGNGLTRNVDTTLGILVSESMNVNVNAARFDNFGIAIAVKSSSKVGLAGNRINAMTTDGINIFDSHSVTATFNTCTGSTPYPGAHPDCIQLWSVAGKAPQSNINVTNNTAIGATQGFTSFNAADGGGVRISFIGNTVYTSWSQGIACYGCFDSIVKENILSTLPGSQFQTMVRVIGGANNYVGNNSVAPYLGWPGSTTGEVLASDFEPSYYFDAQTNSAAFAETPSREWGTFSGAEDSQSLTRADIMSSEYDGIFAAVPEPATWAQLIMGFGLVGAFARRRTRALA